MTERDSKTERRSSRRLAMRLAVVCRSDDDDRSCVLRATTRDVSPAGLFLETDEPAPAVGDRLAVELVVPASEGVASQSGRAEGAAEVVRVQPLPTPGRDSSRRFGIAARFSERLRFSFPEG